MSREETMAEKHYEVINIGAGAWRIEEEIVRTFLFVGADRALLIDTGVGGGDLKAVVSGITDLPVTLVNTHADEDHIGCNAQFDVAHMHPAEYAWYFTHAPADAKVAPLWEGDVIDLGGRCFEVVFIPGHTPGSIALLDRQNAVLIAGDSVSYFPIFIFGDIRDIRAFRESMVKLLKVKMDFNTVYPSHGSFPVHANQIDKLKTTAEKLIAGELKGVDPPLEIPALMYEFEGSAFFYTSRDK
jgi:glyoxylase-like metal-dependent hydrolase (beta-lactamase superfamily II)